MAQTQATTLLLLALGAFIIPLLCGRIRVPAAVGEILYGILLAHYGLGLVEPSDFTAFLGQFGFAFLMFLAGMEIDFAQVEHLGRKGVLIVLLIVTLVFGLSATAVYWFDKPPLFVLVLGAMSLGLALVALRDTGNTGRPLGQLVLIAGTVGEFVTIILLTLTDLAGLHGLGMDMVLGLGKLAALFVVAAIALVLLRTVVWWFPHRFETLIRSEDSGELGVRGAFALLLASIAAAMVLDVEVILGAFLAGVLIAFAFREKQALEHKLSSFGFGFFIPIFFINVGITFDPGSLQLESFMSDFLFLLVAGFVVRAAPTMLLVLLGLRIREAFAAGLILCAPLTLLVAIAQVGEETGLVPPHVASSIIVYALVGGILFPTLFKSVASKKAS